MSAPVCAHPDVRPCGSCSERCGPNASGAHEHKGDPFVPHDCHKLGTPCAVCSSYGVCQDCPARNHVTFPGLEEKVPVCRHCCINFCNDCCIPLYTSLQHEVSGTYGCDECNELFCGDCAFTACDRCDFTVCATCTLDTCDTPGCTNRCPRCDVVCECPDHPVDPNEGSVGLICRHCAICCRACDSLFCTKDGCSVNMICSQCEACVKCGAAQNVPERCDECEQPMCDCFSRVFYQGRIQLCVDCVEQKRLDLEREQVKAAAAREETVAQRVKRRPRQGPEQEPASVAQRVKQRPRRLKKRKTK